MSFRPLPAHATARDQVIAWIAAYDHGGATPAERQLVRLLHRWLRMLKRAQPTRAAVLTLMDELEHPPSGDRPSGWEDITTAFRAWARRDAWLDPEDETPRRSTRP